MSGLLLFVIKAVGISMSGVLMPGPVTAVTLAKGQTSPHAGALVALGHGILEFPLMILLAFVIRAANIFEHPSVRAPIGIAGGLILLWMGYGMLRTFRSAEVREYKTKYSALSAGFMLSIANPYFLIFWGTVGTTLILGSLEFGLIGFIIFMLAHWLADFLWLYFLSAMSYLGGHFFGNKLQMGLFIICGLALLFFGGQFIVDAILTLTGGS